jgi:arsenate reductase
MTTLALPVLDQPEVVACCAPLSAEVLGEDDAQLLSRQFAALADPVRLRLVSLLATADGAVCACDPRGAGRPEPAHRLPPPEGAGRGRPGHQRATRTQRLVRRRARRARGAARRSRSVRLTRLARQALAEFLGSAGLVTVVVGSGIAAQRLSPDDVGLQLLENALATGAGLVALILAFGPVSGGHFNPVITLADRYFGGVSTRQVAVYLPAQVLGGVAGAVVANLMFELPAVSLSTTDRTGGGLWLSESVATFGLVVLVFLLARAGRAAMAPFAVGAYITAAYWWSSSTSFANPMIDVARTLSDTFAGIAPASVPMFLLAQLVGGAAAVVVVVLLQPTVAAVADDVVVPKETP